MRPNLRVVSRLEFAPGTYGSDGGNAGMTGEKPRNGNGHNHKPTILVVEDEVLVRAPLADFLRQQNYRVLEAASADEAKVILESREPIELVFSDVHMPGTMNGFELAQWVRQQFPDVGVLLTSGVSQLVTTTGYGAELGPVLPKPYSLDTALTLIKRLLLA